MRSAGGLVIMITRGIINQESEIKACEKRAAVLLLPPRRGKVGMGV